jgi:hypothetical protein
LSGEYAANTGTRLLGVRAVEKKEKMVGFRRPTLHDSTHGDTGLHASRRWFPIHQEVRYQCVKGTRICEVGIGKTLGLSSSEVRFTTQQLLKPGQRMRLAIDWPALLDNTCRMKLEICGGIVQSQPGEATVKIERHEFRTRGTQLAVIAS